MTTRLPESSDELMRRMERWILSPQSHVGREDLDPLVALSFQGSAMLSPAEQLDVYRQQFWLRHAASLAEDFPGVQTLLGEELWRRASVGYLSRAESLRFALRDLGQGFPGYLEQQRHLGTLPQSVGDLASDMARLEWAYVDVFDAPDEPELDAAKVVAILPEEWPLASFRISSAVRLLELSYPVPDLRRSIKQGHPLELPQGFPEPAYWVVYRRDRRLWDKQVSEPAFRLLRHLSEGLPLIPSCEAVVARLPDAERRLDEELFTWFSLWGKLGWIRDVEPGRVQAAGAPEDSKASSPEDSRSRDRGRRD